MAVRPGQAIPSHPGRGRHRSSAGLAPPRPEPPPRRRFSPTASSSHGPHRIASAGQAHRRPRRGNYRRSGPAQEELARPAPVAGMDLLAPDLTDEEFRIVGEFVARPASSARRLELARSAWPRGSPIPSRECPMPAATCSARSPRCHASESHADRADSVRRHGAAEQLAPRQGAAGRVPRPGRRVSRQGLRLAVASRAARLRCALSRDRRGPARLRLPRRSGRSSGSSVSRRRAQRALIARLIGVSGASGRDRARVPRGGRGRARVRAGRGSSPSRYPRGVGYLALRERPRSRPRCSPDAMLERRRPARLAAPRGALRRGPDAADVRSLRRYHRQQRTRRVLLLRRRRIPRSWVARSAGVQRPQSGRSGAFANVGLLGYLLEFIAGHGAIELFAIWVAGAAGLLLGQGPSSPPESSREATRSSWRVASSPDGRRGRPFAWWSRVDRGLRLDERCRWGRPGAGERRESGCSGRVSAWGRGRKGDGKTEGRKDELAAKARSPS